MNDKPTCRKCGEPMTLTDRVTDKDGKTGEVWECQDCGTLRFLKENGAQA